MTLNLFIGDSLVVKSNCDQRKAILVQLQTIWLHCLLSEKDLTVMPKHVIMNKQKVI